MEEENPAPKGSALEALLKEDLSLLGMEELGARIEILQDEIARTQGMLESKKGSRSDAEALFSK